MYFYFQLTYSVTNGSIAENRKIRDKISELEEYEHLTSVETTLVGQLELLGIRSAMSSARKRIHRRIEAEKIIVDIIKDILKDNYANSTTVYCSLMVDDLGKHIEFDVSI